MSAPQPSPPLASDPKLQAKLGNVKNTAAAVIVGRKDIGNCEDCDFIITSPCTKILVESCKKSRVTLNGRVATNILEVWKCDDIVTLVNTKISTIQADICKKLHLEFTKKEHYNQVVWAGVHDLTISFRDAAEHRLETGFAQAKAKHPDLSEQTDQFYVRFVDNVLLEELIVRLKNGYPTTEREAAFFDEQQKKKEEHMRKEAEKLIKFVPKKYLKTEEKVGRNEKCPCNSGKKYKACCGVPKKDEAKDENGKEKKEPTETTATETPAAAPAAAPATSTPPAASPAPAQP